MDTQVERTHILKRIQTRGEAPTAPVLREIAQEWRRLHPKISSEPLFALVEALWAAGLREARLVALYLLESCPQHIPVLDWDRIDRWRGDLDSRELTDTLAQRILGAWLLANPAHRFGHLWNQLIRGDVWNQRLALMATISLNRTRADINHPGVALFLVDQVKDTRRPVITEAISCALQALAQIRPGVVATYVDHNREISV